MTFSVKKYTFLSNSLNLNNLKFSFALMNSQYLTFKSYLLFLIIDTFPTLSHHNVSHWDITKPSVAFCPTLLSDCPLFPSKMFPIFQ